MQMGGCCASGEGDKGVFEGQRSSLIGETHRG